MPAAIGPRGDSSMGLRVTLQQGAGPRRRPAPRQGSCASRSASRGSEWHRVRIEVDRRLAGASPGAYVSPPPSPVTSSSVFASSSSPPPSSGGARDSELGTVAVCPVRSHAERAEARGSTARLIAARLL